MNLSIRSVSLPLCSVSESESCYRTRPAALSLVKEEVETQLSFVTESETLLQIKSLINQYFNVNTSHRITFKGPLVVIYAHSCQVGDASVNIGLMVPRLVSWVVNFSLVKASVSYKLLL